MESLLTRSVRIWATGFAVHLRPVPPAMLLGLVLSIANLWVARPGELTKAESRLVWTGIFVAAAYLCHCVDPYRILVLSD